jgi:hypothetical protein
MFGGKTPDFVLLPFGIPAGDGLSLYAGQSNLPLLQAGIVNSMDAAKANSMMFFTENNCITSFCSALM